MLDFEVFYSYFLVGFRLFRGFFFSKEERQEWENEIPGVP